MHRLLITTLLLFTGTALGDLNSWNDGTNANINVAGLVAQGITNTARTASTFVVAGSAKQDTSTATSSLLSATLTDETGSGVAVFGTSPTFTTSLTLTNSTTGTAPFVINDVASGTGSRIQFNVNGTAKLAIDTNGTMQIGTASADLTLIKQGSSGPSIQTAGSGASFLLQPTGSGGVIARGTLQVQDSGGGNSCVLTPEGTGTLQLGSDAASPASQIFKGPDGSGTDKAGGSLTLEGGAPTGTGTGGGVILKTAVTSTTGSSLGTQRDRFRAVPKFVDLTDASAITLFTVSLPATNIIGITFSCTVQCSNGTDFQSLTTPVAVDAVAKSTTITAVVAPTAAQTTLAGSSGTLSVTYTVVDNGSNVLAVKCNADTSLTSLSYLRAQFVMTAINGSGVGWSIAEQ